MLIAKSSLLEFLLSGWSDIIDIINADNNNNNNNELASSIDVIIKVASPADPDLTTINWLQYKGSTLTAFRLAPVNPGTIRKTG